MKIIFAQGNPEPTYQNTRHNLGFAVLDAFAVKSAVTFTASKKFHADIAELQIPNEKILLVKPTTFYNETGSSARALVDFYKLDTGDLLVLHDELSLPFGTIKTRFDGSDAGNNGIKSLNTHIGPNYARIRLGIYNSLRDQMNDADFVLGKFSKAEREALPRITEQAHAFISDFIHGTLVPTRISLPL
jgi:PTH1 family peptidyl-tRNA hydrolase